MLVTSQLPIQTTKFAIISFERALVPPPHTLKKVPSPMASARLSLLQTLTKVAHRISLKNKMSLKKFQVIWQSYLYHTYGNQNLCKPCKKSKQFQHNGCFHLNKICKLAKKRIMTSIKLGWNLNGEIHHSKMYSTSVLGCLCDFSSHLVYIKITPRFFTDQ